MLAKTGLLVLSNPRQISHILNSVAVQQQVKNTLYIQLLSALGEPFGTFYPNIFPTWPMFSKTISKIYSQAARDCKNLDVRVLLSGIKYQTITQIQTQSPIDLVIFDKTHSQSEIDKFLQGRVGNIAKDCGVITVDCSTNESNNLECIKPENNRIYKHAVLGGTFDRLHIAHKLLLSDAALRSNDKVTVGVTEENMLKSKTLWELVQPINYRVNAVQKFLTDICPELDISVVPIKDPYGPTQHDPSMELLIVSAETLGGGNKVNEVRKSNSLKPLDVLAVELIDEPHPNPNEEAKVSSSTARMRLLGTLINPIINKKECRRNPYVIGLTGGIASGKSNVARYLNEKLGAYVIDCDKIAHELYKPGKPCHTIIIENFGKGVLDDVTGEINRKELGAIVFKDPRQLTKLNSLVWPAIAAEVSSIICNSDSNVVVIEAAVLLTAGWQNLCDEVWTTLVPKEVAVQRLKSRNNLSEEQAVNRIESQQCNKYYVENANVVLCSLWPVEYTRQQIDRAWTLLQERVLSRKL